MKTSRRIFLLLLVLLTIALGFLRDFVFVSINHCIETGRDTDGKLALLKWALTFFFSVLYLLITCVFLYFIFHGKKYIWLALIAYGTLFTVSFLAALGGHIFSSFEHVYPFIRMVMGVAQSPVATMILIAACYLNMKLESR